MSGKIEAALAGLKAALESVTGPDGKRLLAVSDDPVVTPATPAAVIGPAVFQWEGMCVGDPTEALWYVYIVTHLAERALERLYALVPLVSEAIDTQTGGVVRRATPGTWAAQGPELPAYVLEIEVPL